MGEGRISKTRNFLFLATLMIILDSSPFFIQLFLFLVFPILFTSIVQIVYVPLFAFNGNS